MEAEIVPNGSGRKKGILGSWVQTDALASVLSPQSDNKRERRIKEAVTCDTRASWCIPYRCENRVVGYARL